MVLYKRFIVGLMILFFTCSIEALPPFSVLFVVEYFPAPSQTYILNMMTGLIDCGHQVSIFAFCQNNVTEVHPDIEKYGLLNSVIYGKLPAELPEYDIVFCQNGSLGKKFFEIEGLTEWLRNRKLVVCLRGADITANVKDNPDLYKELFVEAQLFLPVCEYFKNKLVVLGCDPDKIVVHHSAINCSQFSFKKIRKPKKGLMHLVSVCRLVKKKGIDDAIKAVAMIAQKYKNIHYTIVGDGPEQARLEKLINDLKIKNKVTLFGWGTQEQVVNILNRSHIFLLPSTTSAKGTEEGIANALKEAMAMGLISVATWHAGTPELIQDSVSGFLVPEKNSFQLAKTIKYIIKHPKMWKAVQWAARKKVEEEFETQKSIKKLEKIFYQLLG